MKNHKFTILVFTVIGISAGIFFANFKEQKALNKAIQQNQTTPKVLKLRIDEERISEKIKNQAINKEIEVQSLQRREDETTILRRSLTTNKEV